MYTMYIWQLNFFDCLFLKLPTPQAESGDWNAD